MGKPTLAPENTWFDKNTDNIQRSSIEEIEIADSYTPKGTEYSWVASADDSDGVVTCYVDGTKLIIAGNGSKGIYTNADSKKMFYGTSSDTFSNVKSIKKLDLLDTSNTTTFYAAFQKMEQLQTIEGIANWNTSSVTDMTGMFINCYALTYIDCSGDNWITNNVTNFSQMFNNCYALKDIEGLDKWVTSSATTFKKMFAYCKALTKLTDISEWDTSKVTDMNSVFLHCESLVELDLRGWDTRQVTDATYFLTNLYQMVYQLGKIYYSSSIWGLAVTKGLFIDVEASPPTLLEMNTWFDTTKAARSSIEEIEIVDRYLPTGNETVSWNADVTNKGDITCYVDGTKLIIAGNGHGKIFTNPDSTRLFYGEKIADNVYNTFDKVTAINGLDLLDTSKTTIFYALFNRMSSLTIIKDIADWDTSSVTDMTGVFANCTKLNNIEGLSCWDTSKVKTFSQMFSKCVNLKDLSSINGWNTSSATDMGSMFRANDYEGDMLLENLDLSNWNTSNVTDMGSMFYGCARLQDLNLNNWDVSKVENFSHTFADCFYVKNIYVSKWDVSNCTSFDAIFNDCMELEVLDLSGWKTSNGNLMSQMFEGCKKLKQIIGIENFDTSNAWALGEMFQGCSGLEALDLSKWDVSNVITFQKMFQWCGNLVTIDCSNWNTKNAAVFLQMFCECRKLKNIIGIENFVTTAADITINATDPETGADKGAPWVWHFYQMFMGCESLEELNLSNFYTRKASDFTEMFANCKKLKTIYVGDGWGLDSADASATREDKTGMTSTDNKGKELSVAANLFTGCNSLVGEDGTICNASNSSKNAYAKVDGEGNTPGFLTHINNKDRDVFVNSKSLYRTAKAIRNKLGTSNRYLPSEMEAAIKSI